METIVEAENLEKTYQLGKIQVAALRGINLKIERSDFLAILGPSGSGKSTLLNLIGALDKPTAGKLVIEGVDTFGLAVSVIFSLYPAWRASKLKPVEALRYE